jgi:hypothetical protein
MRRRLRASSAALPAVHREDALRGDPRRAVHGRIAPATRRAGRAPRGAQGATACRRMTRRPRLRLLSHHGFSTHTPASVSRWLLRMAK